MKLIVLFTLLCCIPLLGHEASRPRAREAGVVVGILPVGTQNAITDVAGVTVGHKTIIQGENVHTGVTAILPHRGNLFREKVPDGARIKSSGCARSHCTCARLENLSALAAQVVA